VHHYATRLQTWRRVDFHTGEDLVAEGFKLTTPMQPERDVVRPSQLELPLPILWENG
jgi:hypothetical protein